MKKYAPELGQFVFGQPYKQYECPEWLCAFIEYIRDEWQRVSWNVNQKELADPWSNTGGSYKNDTFQVEAYSWDEDKEQSFNFKWKDVEISWYKHSRRGTTVNQKIGMVKGNKLLRECLESLRKEDKKLDNP